LIHGKATVQAISYKDRVCTTDWDCADDFVFYGAVSQTGIAQPVEGYLGLSQDYPKNGDESLERGPMYVNALVKGDVIPNREFAFVMYDAYQDMTSHVEFGPLSTKEISAKASRIAFIQFNTDYYWSIAG
jgi:hypothetical protein